MRSDPNTELINLLRDRHLLLILDNFEDVISAAPLVVELLQAAPKLKLIVTSRLRLRLNAEWLVHSTWPAGATGRFLQSG